MEMKIPVMSTPQQTSSYSVAGANSGAEANGNFQQALVQQIVGQSDSGQQLNESTGLVAVISQLGALITQNEGDAQLVAEDVLTMIDGLVDSLEVNATETEAQAEELQAEDLQAMLEQLNALLSLLGISQPKQELPATDIPEGNSSTDQMELAVTELKGAIQNSLLQLQAVVQQGSLKQVQGQEPLTFISSQLQALTSALTGDGKSQELKSGKTEENVPTWLNTQSSTTKDASVLLQRLSQQAVHPSLFNVVNANSSNQSLPQQELSVGNAETMATQQIPFVIPDNVREFAPLLSKTAVPTEFVLAEDFAETMNGLIVQKFDIRSLNGLSEAKLMLFPEHLGQVDVRISMQNGLLTAVFQTDTAMAKDMLDNQMAQLRAALQAQGLTVDKLEVTHSPATSELTHQHPGQGNQGQQSSGNRQGFKDDVNVRDTAFESELVEQAAINGLGYGRTINETA